MNPIANDLLLAACKFGDVDGIRESLDAGADPNVKSKSGHRPASALGMAIQSGSVEAVKQLLDGHASPHTTEQGFPLLAMAGGIEKNQAKILMELIEHGASPWELVQPRGSDFSDGMTTAIYILGNAEDWGVEQGDTRALWNALAETFVEGGMMEEINEAGRSKLLFSLNNFAFPHSEKQLPTPYFLLLEALDEKVGCELWNTPIGATFEAQGWHLASLAAQAGDWTMLQWLLDHGADPGVRTPKSLTDEGYPCGNASLETLMERDYETSSFGGETLRKSLLDRVRGASIRKSIKP